ncbi:hypothetical protein, partial [Pseudomonas atacamensis]
HDQEVGLSYLAEVEWLRGCKADSRLAVVVKVGLYLGAVESEAVGCRLRSYVVKAGLDDWTTFENYDWNNWAVCTVDRALPKISFFADEYFLELSPPPNEYGVIILAKSFQEVEESVEFEFGFDFKATNPIIIRLCQNNVEVFYEYTSSNVIWQSRIVRFSVAKCETPKTLLLYLYAGGTLQPTYLKNLRLKKTT